MRLRAALVACPTVVGAVVALGVPAQAVDSSSYQHHRARAESVIDGFYDSWLVHEQAPFSWSGDVSACRPGRPSDAVTASTFAQINYFRAVAGLRPVGVLGDLDGAVQQTALMMDANRALSHDPPQSWACRTKLAARTAGRSNLALGSTVRGAPAITQYVLDPGRHNKQVGHRRWLFNPRTARMASGSTRRANALAVVGMPQHSEPVPSYVPWPARGAFPSPLEPRGRWSLSASRPGTDFSRARVRVLGPKGNRIPLTRRKVKDGMGPNTLVWQMSRVKRPSVGQELSYRVRVTKVRRNGRRLDPVRWTVTLVRPDRPVLSTAAPTISGTPEVGSTLVVSDGAWSPAPSSLEHQWFRDGEPLVGQVHRFYRLQERDAGTVISVRVRAGVRHYVSGRVTAQVSVPGR
ncbi:CAP domain-containing protein [Nocardioides donggukensis]|uniref:SCP domain-containing protein n=1 Tax=Nocardioides donggukensis TaxID=2774019 RepID=A0A927K2R3_9ACTN|nr:CAP domain-containing protein [Nocardioides donggukensis]MBD8869472.1 hypothetical protein [Nocardioides donggukensis]